MENVAKFLKPYSTPPKAKHTGMKSTWDEGAKGTARPGAFGAGMQPAPFLCIRAKTYKCFT